MPGRSQLHPILRWVQLSPDERGEGPLAKRPGVDERPAVLLQEVFGQRQKVVPCRRIEAADLLRRAQSVRPRRVRVQVAPPEAAGPRKRRLHEQLQSTVPTTWFPDSVLTESGHASNRRPVSRSKKSNPAGSRRRPTVSPGGKAAMPGTRAVSAPPSQAAVTTVDGPRGCATCTVAGMPSPGETSRTCSERTARSAPRDDEAACRALAVDSGSGNLAVPTR